MKAQGFTVIELILVIVLLAILGGLVLPRLSALSAPAVHASRDDLVAALFYAQQIAMARDSTVNPIRVVTTSNSVSVTENGTPLLYGSLQYPLVLEGGVVLSPVTTLNFDKLGRTTANAFTLSKSGVSATVMVSDSGYAN